MPAMISLYPAAMGSREDEEETGTMLHCENANFEALRAFASSVRCPRCGQAMIAPVASEFVEGGEIRHYWECDACGDLSASAIALCGDE